MRRGVGCRRAVRLVLLTLAARTEAPKAIHVMGDFENLRDAAAAAQVARADPAQACAVCSGLRRFATPQPLQQRLVDAGDEADAAPGEIGDAVLRAAAEYLRRRRDVETVVLLQPLDQARRRAARS